MSEIEIPIIYGRIISSMAGKTPTAIRQVLKGVGLDENPGNGQAGYINNAQYEQLLRNAQSVSGDSLVALRAGAVVPLSVHGPLAIAATTCKTLRESIETISQYTKLRSPFCDIRLQQQGKKLLMTFNMQPVLGDQSEAALDFMLSTIGCHIPNLGCRLPIAFSLSLSRPKPDNALQYKKLLGCDVIYNQPRDAFIFDECDMDIELLGADEEEYKKSVEQLKKILFSFKVSDKTEDSVINIFIKKTGYLCTLEDVAKQMLTTPRTLQRRLRSENLSFQGLRDIWLGQQAMSHLTLDKLSVEVTATLLGYSDTANFRRSFKRWFGQPPSHYTRRK